ncbi:MAG: hypothetical protein IJK27_04765 [Bacilli bacterium]|nr:hypothetical protein [Bacilli bacterium]
MLKNICKYIELALSFLLLGTTIYQSVVGGRLFLLVSLLFLIETVIYSLALFNKTLRLSSLIQFIHSPLAMVVLLISVVLNGETKYSLLLIVITSIYLLLKIGIIVYYYFDYKKKNDVISYAKFYNGLCSLLYVINLLTVVIAKNVAIESTVLLYLLILIIVNALSTFAVAYFALAYLVTTYSLKTLSFKEKINAVSSFFIKYELGFIISEIFCFATMIVSFINVNKNQFFFYLGMFYSIIFTARLITFLWNKSLEKKETNSLLLSKKKHGILLFNSLFFLAAGDLLSISSILLSALRASSNIPAWFFVGFMFPFSILSFVLSMIHRKTAKTIDNAYLNVTVDQSLITSLFSFLAGLSYFFKYIPNNDISGLLWLLLWLGVLTIITIVLIISFVHSIIGLIGKRGTQKNSPDIASEL